MAVLGRQINMSLEFRGWSSGWKDIFKTKVIFKTMKPGEITEGMR